MEAVRTTQGSTLQAAKLTDFAAAQAGVDQPNMDKAAASTVDHMIAALPESYKLTPGNRAAVEAACAAFKALTQDQKQLVMRAGKLLFAETKMRMLTADVDAALAVDRMIAALPPAAELTIFSLKDVIATCKAYEALDSYRQRPLVTKLAVLKAMKVRLPELLSDLEAARSVDDQITFLPFCLQFTDKPRVEAARDAYEALTGGQKQLVRELARLEAAEAEMVRMEGPSLLEEAKDGAFYALFCGFNEADYSPENRIHIRDARTSGFIAIQTADTVKDVYATRDAALATMHAIPKVAHGDPEALAAAKAAAHRTLDASLSAGDPISYSPKNWAVLAAYKANGDEQIEAAATIDAVHAAGDAALRAMSAIPTSIAV